MDATAYARQLKHLLPPSRFWDTRAASTIGKVLLGLADGLSRVDLRVQDMLREWNPSTADEMIEDWEALFSITPDTADLALRRRTVVQRLVSRGGQSRAFFIALAATLGYTITIDEGFLCRVGSRVGSRTWAIGASFTWRVNVAGPADAGTPALEVAVGRSKPAHTTVFFSYS